GAGSAEPVRFSCFEETGGTLELAPGTYAVSAALVAFDESTVFTAPTQELVVGGASEPSLPIAFDLPGARIAGAWSIVQAGAAAACTDVGAHTVEILAT